jgi:hypothetical protein
MAQLKTLALKKQQAKAELKAFRALLDGKGKGDLGEANDILPFLDANEHLCALMGTYNPNIVDYKNICMAREFSIFGDHKADLVIGDAKNKQFCFIEVDPVCPRLQPAHRLDSLDREQQGDDGLRRAIPLIVHPVQYAPCHRPRQGPGRPLASRTIRLEE